MQCEKIGKVEERGIPGCWAVAIFEKREREFSSFSEAWKLVSTGSVGHELFTSRGT